MTALQCRMARAGLGISAQALAKLAGCGRETVFRFERGGEAYVSTVEKMKETLEAKGATFLPDDGNGPGVRVKQHADN